MFFAECLGKLTGQRSRQADGLKHFFEGHALFGPIYNRQHLKDYRVAGAEATRVAFAKAERQGFRLPVIELLDV